MNNSKYQLNIISEYGDNEAYHPKVLSFENDWNGYKYWMSYTPYPQGDDSGVFIVLKGDRYIKEGG